jgi:hypothetical protein
VNRSRAKSDTLVLFVALALVLLCPLPARAVSETCTMTSSNPVCWDLRITWKFSDGLQCRYDYKYCALSCITSRFNFNAATQGEATVLDTQSGGWLTFKENVNGTGTAYMYCPSIFTSDFDWTDSNWDLYAPAKNTGCPIVPQANQINCGCDSPYLSYYQPSYNPAGSTCVGGLDCFGCTAASTNTSFCNRVCPP